MPYPSAVKDLETGNYFTDATKTTMLDEVVVKEDKIYVPEATGRVVLSPDDNLT